MTTSCHPAALHDGSHTASEALRALGASPGEIWHWQSKAYRSWRESLTPQEVRTSWPIADEPESRVTQTLSCQSDEDLKRNLA